MVVADLHVHTANSDGTLALADVPAAARRAGLEAVAITDHDRLHPDLEAPAIDVSGDARVDGGDSAGDDDADGSAQRSVTLVHGIELRVDTGDQRVDLLGYGARRTGALTAEIDRLQRDRIERGRAIIERVEDRLGLALPIEPERGIGRPDVARAVVASDADYGSLDAVFADLIGNDGPCYVSRDVPSFERGRDLLAAACSVVGLAHPLRYRDPEGALALAAGLDAVEVHYPYDGTRDTDRVARAAERHDLLVTGGSDAHDRTLGVRGLDRATFDAFAEALAGQ